MAELSGLNFGYLAKLERGEEPVSKRAVLEALVTALRVSPTELTGQPHTPSGQAGSGTREALVLLEEALESFALGVDPGVPIRAWGEIQADITRLTDLIHVHADHAAQGVLTPRLMAELHSVCARQPDRRRDALLGLIHCYSFAWWTTKRLGGRGLPLVAARMAQECARELGSPAWIGYAVWLRSDAAGQLGRWQQCERNVRTADELRGSLSDPEVRQCYGMLHLSAALGAAARRDRGTATAHLDEADAIADRLDEEVGTFARLWFGRTNVEIWRVGTATELGDGPKVAEVARTTHPEVLPSRSRQAEFLCDLGRLPAPPHRHVSDHLAPEPALDPTRPALTGRGPVASGGPERHRGLPGPA